MKNSETNNSGQLLSSLAGASLGVVVRNYIILESKPCKRSQSTGPVAVQGGKEGTEGNGYTRVKYSNIKLSPLNL